MWTSYFLSSALENSTAVITGTSSEIGEVFASALAARDESDPGRADEAEARAARGASRWSTASGPRSKRADYGQSFSQVRVSQAESRLPIAKEAKKLSFHVAVKAERVGFEPTSQLSPRTAFPVPHLRPLGHLSET